MGEEWIRWANPACFCHSEDGLVCGGGDTHMLICCVISSPLLLHLSPHPHLHPTPASYPLPVEAWMRLKAAMWLPAVTDSLSDCPLFVCLYVCLSVWLSVCPFILCGPVRAPAEDWTELLWSMLGGHGAPTAVALRVFLQKGQKKKMTKPIFSSL